VLKSGHEKFDEYFEDIVESWVGVELKYAKVDVATREATLQDIKAYGYALDFERVILVV
jgi:hypothetical protein